MTHPQTLTPSFWSDKRVLLTGHTGFKGSWLALWLQSMGVQQLVGYALEPPTHPNLFEIAQVGAGMISILGDMRDLERLKTVFTQHRPEIVIHMAAQSLVRQSYQNPVETYSTNVMGTVHLLEAVRHTPSVKSVVNVTTDKCYEPREESSSVTPPDQQTGYSENEPMGGLDPYSNSKACSEFITSAYRRSFLQHGAALASARAGNVIGGGDWATDRLVPDILKAFEQQRPVLIRNPHAIRPWQHVLEPLSGYLLLAENLFTHGQAYAEGWNFGPTQEGQSVQWIVEQMAHRWGGNRQGNRGLFWQPFETQKTDDQPHETHRLTLNSAKANTRLGWNPHWPLEQALQATIEWHQHWLTGANMNAITREQMNDFQSQSIATD